MVMCVRLVVVVVVDINLLFKHAHIIFLYLPVYLSVCVCVCIRRSKTHRVSHGLVGLFINKIARCENKGVEVRYVGVCMSGVFVCVCVYARARVLLTGICVVCVHFGGVCMSGVCVCVFVCIGESGHTYTHKCMRT